MIFTGSLWVLHVVSTPSFSSQAFALFLVALISL